LWCVNFVIFCSRLQNVSIVMHTFPFYYSVQNYLKVTVLTANSDSHAVCCKRSIAGVYLAVAWKHIWLCRMCAKPQIVGFEAHDIKA